jgi:hypothetical protein
VKELPRLSTLSPSTLQNAPFCIAVIWEAALRREPRTITMEVWVEDDPLVAIDGTGRRILEYSPGEEWMQAQLTKFSKGEEKTVKVASSDFPIRASAGGALPLLRLKNGQEYFVLMQREIMPFAWNTASGLSSNLEEICTPSKVIFREAFEELLVTVRDKAFAWHTTKFDEFNSTEIVRHNLKLWKLSKQIVALPLTVKPVSQRYKLITHYKAKTTVLDDEIILVVYPKGFDALTIPVLDVPAADFSQVNLYDCEEGEPDVPLDRKIGLLSLDEAKKVLQEQQVEPIRIEAIFKGGENLGPMEVDYSSIASKVQLLEKSGVSLRELFGALSEQEKETFMASRYCTTAYEALRAYVGTDVSR